MLLHKKLKVANSLLEDMYIDLRVLTNLVNFRGSMVWEQSRSTCEQIDSLAREIRVKLPDLEDKIMMLMD